MNPWYLVGAFIFGVSLTLLIVWLAFRSARNTARLDNHEVRLVALEQWLQAASAPSPSTQIVRSTP